LEQPPLSIPLNVQSVETLPHKCNVKRLYQIQSVFLLKASSFPLSDLTIQSIYSSSYECSFKNFLMTSAKIFPDVFGATTPGRLRARMAFIPRCLAYLKSVPPGLEAKSMINPCEGRCCMASLFITGAGTVLINKSHVCV